MTLITTPLAANADSLASIADATVYVGMFQAKVRADWDAASVSDQESALRQASELMAQLPWKGIRTTQLQPMCWPRCDGNAKWDPLSPFIGVLFDRDGYPVDAQSIPRCIVQATCEFAFRLFDDDRIADAGALAPADLKVGSVQITNLQRRPIPPSVIEKVRQFLTTDGFSVKLVRG